MTKFFQVEAQTLLHLGRDSIKDDTTAVMELVKNSYDADASEVNIVLSIKETDTSLSISDNGHGMLESDIDNKWLRIGFSEKKALTYSDLNKRRKTGEKGIGRLSADRLGKELAINSYAKNSITNKYEYIAIKIDWESFNVPNKVISEIPIELIEKRDSDEIRTGTTLTISKLRNQWKKENVLELKEELSILMSPFHETKDFIIKLSNNLYPELNGEIISPLYSKSEVEVEIEYDGYSKEIIFKTNDMYNSEYIKQDIMTWQQLQQKIFDPEEIPVNNELKCGHVKIKLMLYPRIKNVLDSSGLDMAGLREFLDKNAGVRVYRDNISVKPYGHGKATAGTDWLGLAERHTRNPAGVDRSDYRIVPSQLIGAVFIGRDSNPDIIDSAAREGFIENQAFFDLRALALGALSLLETHRYNVYQLLERKKTNKNFDVKDNVKNIQTDLTDIKNSLQTLNNFKEENKNILEINETIEQVNQVISKTIQQEKKIDEILEENRVLGGLATIGIASAVFGHETQTDIDQFKSTAILAQKYLIKTNPDIVKAIENIGKSLDYANKVSAWGRFALTRVQRDKRKKEKRNIQDILDKIIMELENALKAVSIDFVKNIESIEAKAFPMDIESITLNLITNAYTACTQITRNSGRKIKLILKAEENNEKQGFVMIVSDSGPGVSPENRKRIWEPLYSTKTDSRGFQVGTGLGLTIVKSIVDDLKGYVTVDVDPELLGARFKIWLPK